MFEHLMHSPTTDNPGHRVFIPVKAVSERCPDKNWAQLGPGSRPLWARAVVQALKVFQHVAVDTDDLRILDHPQLQQYIVTHADLDNPKVWERRLIIFPRHPSVLGAQTNGVDLYRCWDDLAPEADSYIAQWYCTCPFQATKAVQWALHRLENTEPEVIDAVCLGRWVNEFTWTVDHQHRQPPKRDYQGLPRSQDLLQRLQETTGFYVTRRGCDHRTPDGRTVVLAVETALEALDINTEDDLFICQAVEAQAARDDRG